MHASGRNDDGRRAAVYPSVFWSVDSTRKAILMGCCGARPQPDPRQSPGLECDDGWKPFAPDAWIIAQKRGLPLCSITGTGKSGLVLRQDVESYWR